MLRKIVAIVVLVPLVVLIVAFAIANRQTVVVSFDPFSSAEPAYAARLPLYALILIVLIAGVIIGGFAAWLRQASWRRLARELDSDVRALHQELEAMRRRAEAEELRRGQERRDESRSLTLAPPSR
jgi:uncharacterized membrane protein (DUF106 family)